MPVLTNRKHEAFAQGLTKGKKPPVAYMEAGYDTNGRAAEAAASRLLRNVNILNRIEELQIEIAERFVEDTVITKEKVVKKLMELSAAAAEEGQYSVSSSNWVKLGVEIGMFTAKSEVTVNDVTDKADQLALARARAKSRMNGDYKH